jgi:hypothetical protein
MMIDVVHEMRASVVSHDLASEPRDTPVYGNVIALRRAIGC